MSKKIKLNVTASNNFSNSFPGLLQGDDLPTLVKLLTSKNPDADVAAMVALEGGFNPCDNSTLLGSRKVSTDNVSTSPCDPGFVLDASNGYCYMALDGVNFKDAGADIWYSSLHIFLTSLISS